MALDILVALAATTATPAAAPAASVPRITVAPKSASGPKPDPMQAMAAMMTMFDKFFPAGPEPDPARLAEARQATMLMFPKGAYAEAMNGFANRTADRVLDMSEADFAALAPVPKDKKANAAKVPSTEPLRLVLAKKDPMSDAKIAAVRAFVSTMLVKLGEVAEPKFREGMSRSLARKFDARQLAEIQGFLATPTGAAYGRQMVGLWFEPDVMRGTVEALPEMMRLMPEVAKSGAALEAQMQGGDKK